MTGIERLLECETLIKLVALGEAKAGTDAIARIKEAASTIATLRRELEDAIGVLGIFIRFVDDAMDAHGPRERDDVEISPDGYRLSTARSIVARHKERT